MRGAEAVLTISKILGRKAVVKARIAKKYRVAGLDSKLRTERTRSEARLLHKAKLAGVPCPIVLEVDEFSITMSFIDGTHPAMSAAEACDAGRLLAKLHSADIIHGDYTPANLLLGERMHVIDFGLGFVSNDIEDKAVDVFTMLRAINEKEAFVSGYQDYAKAAAVLARVKNVETRVRYAF